MKTRRNAVKTTTYVAGILAVTAAVITAVLLFMSGLGIIFPRKQNLILRTNDIAFTYSGEVFEGSEPQIVYGELYPGHSIEVMNVARYSTVGEHENAPEFKIVDSVGADVTDMYNITTRFGKFTVEPRKLTVYSESKEKRYDGTSLVSDEITVIGGGLAAGHSFNALSTTSITLPGEISIQPSYSIIDANGGDVTDQYMVKEMLGKLTVLPIPVTISTESASKQYDGTPLSLDKWQHVNGTLLSGHTIKAVCNASVTEVGALENTADVRIYDEDGTDVTQFYEIILKPGTLKIDPLVLHITTGSAEKIYDGKYISCEEWQITSGSLAEGEKIEAVSFALMKNAGDIKNEIKFKITDKNGKVITNRYKIILSAGTLSVAPRAITIQTGSASKKYDGTPIYCKEYKITKGELCAGDKMEVSFTSMVNIGYTENYIVDNTIYAYNENGERYDVTVNYRITYDYGILTITAN